MGARPLAPLALIAILLSAAACAQEGTLPIWRSSASVLTQLYDPGCDEALAGKAIQSQQSGAGCEVMELLVAAKPARKSFVRDFVLDEASVHVLPVMFDLEPGCENLCRQVVANDRRVPLSSATTILSAVRSGPDRLELVLVGLELELTLLARADFTDDGLEDLLILANGHVVGGTWGALRLFVVTRDTPDGVLWVIAPEAYLCPDYHCRPE